MASVSKRGNSYRIKAFDGYDANGKQRELTMTWTPEPGMTKNQIKKELERQKVLFEQRVAAGDVAEKKYKFSDFANKWMKEYAEKRLKPKTVAQYKALLPRLNEHIGHFQMEKIRPKTLNDLYNKLSESGIRQDIKYKCKIDLREELKKLNLTQKNFSEQAEISIKTLESLLRGNNINYQTAKNISDTLEQDFDDVFESVDKKILSAKTIKHYHTMLSSIFSTAVLWEVIPNNPCEKVKPPKKTQKDPVILDDKEISKLFQCLDNEPEQWRRLITLFVYLGLRREELLGLTWDNIDFENNLIRIKQTLQYLPEKGIYVSPTKTTSSDRTIKIGSDVIDIFNEQKDYQDDIREKSGDRWEETGFVFTNDKGKPMHPESVSAGFKRIIKKYNLPDVTLHSLRHSNATIMIANHIPLTTVAKRLGHADASTTSKIYAHAIRSADEAASEIIDNVFDNLKKA